MTTEQKKERIKLLAKSLLDISHEDMIKRIGSAINSGAIDIDSWDENRNPMILPKCIATAIIQDEAESCELSFKGNSLQGQIKKQIKNLKLFL